MQVTCSEQATMKPYSNPSGESTERAAAGAWAAGQAGPGALVTTPISQHGGEIHLYPCSLRVKRKTVQAAPPEPPDRTGQNISGFTLKSKSRLRFAAVNAFPQLISQFGLTYHDQAPTDGRIAKRHLNAWLTYLRRRIPGIGYLWIMEFQSRGAAHFHVFLTIPPSDRIRHDISAAWVRITAGTPEQMRCHDHSKNWIPWEIRSAGYLAKYLDKDAQKTIPDGYSNFGRFWGNSTDLVPDAIRIPLDTIEEESTNPATGEIHGSSVQVIRWLGRLAEKQTNGYSRFRTRAQAGSYTILQGAPAYRQIERYLHNLAAPPLSHSPPVPF
jgi:hypothetical protein